MYIQSGLYGTAATYVGLTGAKPMKEDQPDPLRQVCQEVMEQHLIPAVEEIYRPKQTGYNPTDPKVIIVELSGKPVEEITSNVPGQKEALESRVHVNGTLQEPLPVKGSLLDVMG